MRSSAGRRPRGRSHRERDAPSITSLSEADAEAPVPVADPNEWVRRESSRRKKTVDPPKLHPRGLDCTQNLSTNVDASIKNSMLDRAWVVRWRGPPSQAEACSDTLP